MEALQEVVCTYPEVGTGRSSSIVLAGEITVSIYQLGRVADRECDINLSAYYVNVIDLYFDPVRGFMELSFAPFFCVYITYQVINGLGVLDVESSPDYRFDRIYCDLIRKILGRRIIYTLYSRIYNFVQKFT